MEKEVRTLENSISLFKKEFIEYYEPATFGMELRDPYYDGDKDDNYMTYRVIGSCIEKVFNSLDENDKMIYSLECAIKHKTMLEETGKTFKEFDDELCEREKSSAYAYSEVIEYSLARVNDESIDGLKCELSKFSEASELSEEEKRITRAKIEVIKEYMEAIKNGKIDSYLSVVPYAKTEGKNKWDNMDEFYDSYDEESKGCR